MSPRIWPALAFFASIGCGSGPEPSAGPLTGSDTTNQGTIDTEPTGPGTTDTGAAEDAVRLEPSAPAASPALLTGVVVSCASDTEAHVRAEFVGGLGSVEAVPIVDGTAGAAHLLEVEARSLFHRAEATIAVTDCADTAWQIVATSNGASTCMVTGPGAAEWAAAGAVDCDLR